MTALATGLALLPLVVGGKKPGHEHRSLRWFPGGTPRFLVRVRFAGKPAMHDEILSKLVCHNLTGAVGAIYELGISPEF